MRRVGVGSELVEWADAEGMVPVQWRDLHAALPGSGAERLYRAIVFDAVQAIGRYSRAAARHRVSERQQERRRELVAWLQARGVAAFAYRVPFEVAMLHGLPGCDVEAVRDALLVALQVHPRRRPLALQFERSVLRRHYVRRTHGEAA